MWLNVVLGDMQCMKLTFFLTGRSNHWQHFTGQNMFLPATEMFTLTTLTKKFPENSEQCKDNC